MLRELSGWLLAVYADEQAGAVVWLLGEDGGRYRLRREFGVTFYIGGEAERLARVRMYLRGLKEAPRVENTTRRDLYKGELRVLAVRTGDPVSQRRLLADLERQFKGLRYYDATIPFSIRFGIAEQVFPTAKCRVQVDGDVITALEALDDPWDLDSEALPIRQMLLEPDDNPHGGNPQTLLVRAGAFEARLSLADHPGVVRQVGD